MKTIVVTGAYGSLGSEIVKKIVENNDSLVIAMVRTSSKANKLPNDVLKKIKIFTTDNQKLETLFINYDVDCIIHTATLYGKTESISELVTNNILFPIELIELAAKYKVTCFINTDSYFSKYENYEYLGNYTLSKKHLEDWLKKITDIKVFNLRLEHIYSENDNSRKFVNDVLYKILNNSKVINLTDGKQKRDFIHVSDVVGFYLALINSVNNFQNGFYEFEIGTGKATSIKEFVSKAKEIFKNTDTNLNFGSIPSRTNEIMESKANLSKIPKFINWLPVKSIDEGLLLIRDTWKK